MICSCTLVVVVRDFFFCNQKTAYDMRISDWSSDVALPIYNAPAAAIHKAQTDIRWANHVVILYPLWLGDVPVLRGHSVYLLRCRCQRVGETSRDRRSS